MFVVLVGVCDVLVFCCLSRRCCVTVGVAVFLFEKFEFLFVCRCLCSAFSCLVGVLVCVGCSYVLVGVCRCFVCVGDCVIV